MKILDPVTRVQQRKCRVYLRHSRDARKAAGKARFNGWSGGGEIASDKALRALAKLPRGIQHVCERLAYAEETRSRR